jgi:hypothetical protein
VIALLVILVYPDAYLGNLLGRARS